ncbi:MAG TPA: phosphatase PAP2 family protein, partial [Actinomycetota bacterium]|nr:phosphatase PAP2 family protein [Actinomycetota bacterium]
MGQLGILAGVSVAVGLAWAAVVRALPQADPGRATSRRIGAELAASPRVRGFLRARLDPETATGLVLSLALAGVIATGIVFGVFIAMIRSRSGIVHADLAVTRWAASNGTPSSWEVLGWITEAGSTPTVVIAALATSAYAMRRWRQPTVLLFFVAVVGGQFLLSNLVKFAVERVRPDVAPLEVLPGPSFPSGHATAAAATWAAVALVIGRGASPRVRSTLAGAGAAIAVAVACTRVFLGAHWTS